MSNPNPAEPKVSLREALTILAHDRNRIALAFLLPLALALAFALMSPPRFEATSSLLAKLGREYLYQSEIGESGPGLSFGREETLKSELAIITSRDLVAKAVGEMGIERLYPALTPERDINQARRFETAILNAREDLDAKLTKNANVIDVSFRHTDPDLAATFVNSLVAHYLTRRQELFLDAKVSVLAERAEGAQATLRGLELEIETFKRDAGIVDMERQRELLLTQRADLDTRLKAAANTLAETNDRLAAQQGNVQAAMRTGSGEILRGVEAEILRLRAERVSTQTSLNVLTRQMSDADARIAGMEERRRGLDDLEREAALASETYAIHARKLEEARMTEGLDGGQFSNVRVIQPATPPARPTGMRKIIVAIGIVIALISALLVAFLSEWLRATFLFPAQISRRLGVPVLASIPLRTYPLSALPPPLPRTAGKEVTL